MMSLVGWLHVVCENVYLVGSAGWCVAFVSMCLKVTSDMCERVGSGQGLLGEYVLGCSVRLVVCVWCVVCLCA